MNAKQIKETRIKSGLSQAELAEKIAVSQPLVSIWERGKGKPSGDQLKKLSEVLGDTTAEGTTDASPLAAWLTKARIAKRFSVPELAHHSGLTPPAIYRIEAGITRNLREATRKKLEAALTSALPEDAAKEVAQESEVVGLGILEDFDPHLDSDRPTGPGIYMLYDTSVSGQSTSARAPMSANGLPTTKRSSGSSAPLSSPPLGSALMMRPCASR